MKKLVNIILLAAFVIALALSVSNEFTTKSKVINESKQIASILPIPPPEPPPRKGC